jgi:hypothetical protein
MTESRCHSDISREAQERTPPARNHKRLAAAMEAAPNRGVSSKGSQKGIMGTPDEQDSVK